jgi:hypothetical protein
VFSNNGFIKSVKNVTPKIENKIKEQQGICGIIAYFMPVKNPLFSSSSLFSRFTLQQSFS